MKIIKLTWIAALDFVNWVNNNKPYEDETLESGQFEVSKESFLYTIILHASAS